MAATTEEMVEAMEGEGSTLSPPLTHVRKHGGLVILSSADGSARMTFTGGDLDLHGFTLTPKGTRGA